MLYLSFAVSLKNYTIPEIVQPNGPLFHRWLPDGRTDAVSVPTADERDRLVFWFDRRGYVAADFIRYDNARQEVDPEVMKRQGHLDAGPLRGEAQYAHATSAELEALREDRQGSDEYIALGKRVIDFLYPPLAVFIDLLRCQYGQYWLPELQPWDSRTQSIGSFCHSSIFLRWRENEDQGWREFLPTERTGTIRVPRLPGRGFGEYLTETDWKYLQKTFDPNAGISLALRLLGRAHELGDSGHVAEAFIQLVTGAELAIEHFLTMRVSGFSKEMASSKQSFSTLPLKTRLTVLVTAASLAPQVTLEKALQAIDLRNEIVHQGKQPQDPDGTMFLALMQCAKALLGLKELKTPVLYPVNELTPPEYEGRQAVVWGDES